MAARALKVNKTFALDEDVARKVEEMADAQDLSASQYVNRTLAESVDNDRMLMALLSHPGARQMLAQLAQPANLRVMAEAIVKQTEPHQLRLYAENNPGELGKVAAEHLAATSRKKKRPRKK